MKIRHFVKPYIGWSILAPLLMIIEVTMDLMQPTLMADIVNAINTGSFREDMSIIYITCLKMFIFALIGVCGGLGCTYFSSKASMNFGADLRAELFRRVQSFSFAETDKFSSGSLVTRLTNDVTQLQILLMMGLRMLVRTPIMCIGGIVMALVINVKFGIILLISLPLMFVVLFFIMQRTAPLFLKMQQKVDRINSIMQESLVGVRVVKAYNREQYENEKFGEANEDLTGVSLRVMRTFAVISPIMMLFMNATVIAVLIVSGIEVDSGAMNVGNVTAIITYMTQILMSMMMMSMMFFFFSRGKASAGRVREVLNTESSVVNTDNKQFIPAENGSTVTFHGTCFRYPSAVGEPVVKDVDLDIRAGEHIAILGSTGSGKSSLVNLIPRFYDTTEGSVAVDGIDVKEYDKSVLRDKIGMVLQSTTLFSGTIAENIRWGNPDADDDAVYEAARIAQADEFISSFPDGYDTVLGQGGLELSGGQKQRLCIARAVIRKPRILIMDDSTSALDMATEANLRCALSEKMSGMTTIIIAQRISSVMHSDRIVVLDKGQVVSVGTHDELMKSSEIYQDIYSSQVGQGGVDNG